ncbi:hypothetical protein E2C01_003970 [Portunus trituberculatus]|uniref:Uncharacterized protein n=1 Tax=Portunus trituberculatus TaxID=210409 RepID=A0A5B7CNM5_PORTR|nr:hypothetical protein [Portunus trituberculatus]
MQHNALLSTDAATNTQGSNTIQRHSFNTPSCPPSFARVVCVCVVFLLEEMTSEEVPAAGNRGRWATTYLGSGCRAIPESRVAQRDVDW